MIDINLEDLKSNPAPNKDTKQYYLYFLIYKDQVVYVGQTSLLLSRIIAHGNDKLFTTYKYVLLDTTDRKEVLKIEKFYIDKYKPLFNDSTTATFKTDQRIYHRLSNAILEKDVIYKSDFEDRIKYYKIASPKQFSIVYDGANIYSFITSDPHSYFVHKNDCIIHVENPLHDSVLKEISKYFSEEVLNKIKEKL